MTEKPKLTTPSTKRAWIICGGAFTVIVLLCLALHFTSPFFRTITAAHCYKNYHVPTAAMEPTVMVGDRIRANMCAYRDGEEPAAGDVVVFRSPRNRQVDYVKRIVGIPGDRLQIIDRVFHYNGAEVPRETSPHEQALKSAMDDEPSIKELFVATFAGRRHLMAGNIGFNQFTAANWPATGAPLTVPADEYYVFGDNRDNSSDSRMWGGVPKNDIIGKVEFIVWSKGEDEFRWDRLFERVDTLGLAGQTDPDEG